MKYKRETHRIHSGHTHVLHMEDIYKTHNGIWKTFVERITGLGPTSASAAPCSGGGGERMS